MSVIFLIILLVFCFFVILLSTFQIICLWKIYKKAGKGGWETLIPIYNNYVLVEISGLHWLWFLIPLLSGFFIGFFPDESFIYVIFVLLLYLFALFTNFNTFYNLSKKFGKDIGFAFGLLFLPYVFLPILAFSKKAVYRTDILVSEHGIFGTPKDNNYNNVQSREVVATGDNGNVISFCGECGAKLEADSKFCYNCGNKIN